MLIEGDRSQRFARLRCSGECDKSAITFSHPQLDASGDAADLLQIGHNHEKLFPYCVTTLSYQHQLANLPQNVSGWEL